jgi:hypothetical protein
MAVTDDDIKVPDDASDEEAAAIAAALSAHIAHLEAETAAAESYSEAAEEAWDGDKWAYAGRIESLGGRSVRVPDGAPADSWSAVGRRTRF